MFDFGIFLVWVLSKIDNLGWAQVHGWLRTGWWFIGSLLALLLGSYGGVFWFGFRFTGNILAFCGRIVVADVDWWVVWLAYWTSWIRRRLNHTRSLHWGCDSWGSSILTLRYIATISSRVSWGGLGRSMRHVELWSWEVKCWTIFDNLKGRDCRGGVLNELEWKGL